MTKDDKNVTTTATTTATTTGPIVSTGGQAYFSGIVVSSGPQSAASSGVSPTGLIH